MGVACPGRGCQGRLVQEYPDKALYDQLKFFETLFDVDRAQTKVREIVLYCSVVHVGFFLSGWESMMSSSRKTHTYTRWQVGGRRPELGVLFLLLLFLRSLE